MTTNTNELLANLSALKQRAEAKAAELQSAKVREATIDAKLDELSQTLKKLTGALNWDDLPDAIEKAASVAQHAVEALQAALEQAGVDAE